MASRNIVYLRFFHVEKGWDKQYFDWPIPVFINFIKCIFFLINLMKTGIGQSKYCLPQRFHVEKGWDKQYFDWPIPVFIKFIKCIFFLINLIKTGIGQSKYCIPQPFSRCLITLCSSLFDFNSIFIVFATDHDLHPTLSYIDRSRYLQCLFEP